MTWLREWSAFVRTVDGGSIAAASRQLHCSRAQVSKMLAELERALGVRLIERTTRSQKLTPSGEVFYQQAVHVLAEIKATETALQSTVSVPRGIVRISAPVTFGSLHIAPLLPDIALRHPELHCELVLNDRLVNVADEGFDLAIRLTDSLPADLVARKLATVRRFICASPAYLERAGEPLRPSDLARHTCFAYSHARTHSEWQLRGANGVETVPVRGNYQVNHVETVQAAVLRGEGLAILPDYLCSRALERGALRHILRDYEPLTSFGNFVYLCYPANRARIAKVQAVSNALRNRFSHEPPWR